MFELLFCVSCPARKINGIFIIYLQVINFTSHTLLTWIAVGFSFTSVTEIVNVFSNLIGGLPLSVLLIMSENLQRNTNRNFSAQGGITTKGKTQFYRAVNEGTMAKSSHCVPSCE